MRTFSALVLAMGALLMGGAAVGQQGADPADLLKVRNPQRVTLLEGATARTSPGRPASFVLRFRVEEGFHINSSLPGSEFLIPTTLALKPAPPLKAGKATYAPGKLVTFPFAPDEKLSVYDGEFTVRTSVWVSRSAKPGVYSVRGILRYQACTNNACFPPNEIPIELSLTVAVGPAKK